jgi:hypothetical protein
MEKRFTVVPLCNIKSHFVTIDSSAIYSIMKEICPEFDVRKTELPAETERRTGRISSISNVSIRARKRYLLG